MQWYFLRLHSYHIVINLLSYVSFWLYYFPCALNLFLLLPLKFRSIIGNCRWFLADDLGLSLSYYCHDHKVSHVCNLLLYIYKPFILFCNIGKFSFHTQWFSLSWIERKQSFLSRIPWIILFHLLLLISFFQFVIFKNYNYEMGWKYVPK